MTKKATDILLGIEADVKKTLGHYENQGFLIKTLLNHVKKLEGKIDMLLERPPAAPHSRSEVRVPQGEQPLPKHTGDHPPKIINQQLPGLKPTVQIQKTQQEQQQASTLSRQPQNSGNNFQSFENKNKITRTPDEGEVRHSRQPVQVSEVPAPSGKPVPVQQKMLYGDGKAISMAKIEIFDKETNLIKTLKTNATGKWTSAIPSGDYIVKVSKKGTTRRQAVESQMDITIPNSNDPVQLDPFKEEEAK